MIFEQKELKRLSQSNSSILIVIPARKGSSFHRKNLRPVNGKPLVQYTLEASKISLPHSTVVSTDDPYIIEASEQFGVLIDERPSNLSDDCATLDQVMHYISTAYSDFSIYVCLPPTSPLRNSKHVQEAIEIYSKTPHADSLISVTEERRSVWQSDQDGFLKPLVERLQNRQSEKPVYVANGAIFISSRESVLKSKKKVSGRTIPYVMSQRDSVDVHGEEDLRLAEFWLR